MASTRTAEEIGSWFTEYGFDDPADTLDGNTKLQKLLFFSWLIHRSKFGKSLFDDVFFAFPKGPVVESVRQKYKNSYPLKSLDPSIEFTAEEQETLQLTVNIFGAANSKQLEDASHRSPAWKKYYNIYIQNQKCDPKARKLEIPKAELDEDVLMIDTVLYAYEHMREEEAVF
ncbi:MAG: SocA family protein [Methanosarcinales archaeon]|jgi:uncharacterized phage-associated protein|nr:SocA family protein [Methanosarcinales archaeon]